MDVKIIIKCLYEISLEARSCGEAGCNFVSHVLASTLKDKWFLSRGMPAALFISKRAVKKAMLSLPQKNDEIIGSQNGECLIITDAKSAN